MTLFNFKFCQTFSNVLARPLVWPCPSKSERHDTSVHKKERINVTSCPAASDHATMTMGPYLRILSYTNNFKFISKQLSHLLLPLWYEYILHYELNFSHEKKRDLSHKHDFFGMCIFLKKNIIMSKCVLWLLYFSCITILVSTDGNQHWWCNDHLSLSSVGI